MSASDETRFRLTRFVLLRALGFVYLFAFISLATQLLPLLGEHGFSPAGAYLGWIAERVGSSMEGFLKIPSLFWLGASDAALTVWAWVGVALSLLVLAGYANAILMALLWMIYLSFVHIGQRWYGYGWEIQLCETGFLAIFLCPLIDGRPFARHAPPVAVIWLFRWLSFRIMLGAGLIKIRGDACWRDLSCLYYHYETQPIPNPLSRTLHFMPRGFHQLGVLFNHFAELIAPWLIFAPPRLRRLRIAGGLVMVIFQLILIASGNLSFLNWLTIVPFLACFDDASLRHVLPARWVAAAERAEVERRVPSKAERVVIGGLVVTVLLLSIAPVTNLLSGSQRMNASFDPFDLVNTYGAFGSVGKLRQEIILEGTADLTLDEHTVWIAYELPCKPGDPRRRPCFSGPYHRRLDWQIWFAAMSDPNDEPWMVQLVERLLKNDPGTLSLLANNPFPDQPPHAIRAELYHYQFAAPDDPSGAWWKRRRTREWLPPLTLDDPRIAEFLEAHSLPE